MLELDVQPTPKLVDVERRRGPVDPDLLADAPRFIGGETCVCGHGDLALYVTMR